MQFRTYGRTGCEVSRLGFGAMRLPTREDGKVDRDRAVPLIRRALDGGVNLIDSMLNYHRGESEEVVGDAVRGRRRESYYIQTKTTIYNDPTPEDNFRTRLETALGRLGCEYIDFYLLHSLSKDAWRRNGKGAMAVLRAAQREGLIRFIGFSTHDEPENVYELIGTGEFDCMLVQYNLLDQTWEEAIAWAAEAGLGVSVMGPVMGGRLAMPSELTRLADNQETRTTEACFRYVWSNPNVAVALSGMSEPEQVDENLASARDAPPLTTDEMWTLESAIADKRALADLYCTGCNYCMPCPHKVNIPACFLHMNWYRVYGMREEGRKAYAALVKQESDGGVCQACGECLDKCPQRIEIAEQLAEVHEALAPPGDAG